MNTLNYMKTQIKYYFKTNKKIKNYNFFLKYS